VKVSELVEGLQLVHAGFFTEASFAQHMAAHQHYTLGITAILKLWLEGLYAALPSCTHTQWLQVISICM